MSSEVAAMASTALAIPSLYPYCLNCKFFHHFGGLRDNLSGDPIGTCLSPQGRLYGQKITRPRSRIKCTGWMKKKGRAKGGRKPIPPYLILKTRTGKGTFDPEVAKREGFQISKEEELLI